MDDLLGPAERKCERCGNSFVKRTREGLDRFATRRFCGRACHYSARRNSPQERFLRPSFHKKEDFAGTENEVFGQ